MIKFAIATAAIALAALPTYAAAKDLETRSFRFRGELYTFTVEQNGNQRVLRGDRGNGREPFVLTVGERWVNGTVNGQPVSFSLRSVRPSKGIVVIDSLARR